MRKEDLSTPVKPTWCPGCGNHGIFLAVKEAIVQLGIPHEKLVCTFGIGCFGHMCNFLQGYMFEGLHGRSIPVAEAIKLANKELTVIAFGGDGDTYGEGLNHFITGVRANHDVTLIVHDNRVYGLTTGQASPTSEKGYKAKSTPAGVIEEPVNPVALALANKGTFVARGFSGDLRQLVSLIVAGVRHRGFSVIEVLQNCATWNKVNTVRWYKEHVYKLEDDGHDPSDRLAALARALDEERLATGIFFQGERRPYHDELRVEGGEPLVNHDISNVEIGGTMEQFF